jgi:exosortase
VSLTTLQDLAWVAAIAFLTAASPFLPRDPIVTTVGAAIAGGLVLAYRIWRRRGESSEVSASKGVSLSVPLSVWACLFLFAVVMAPTGRWMFRMWTASIWENGHSVFVPLVILYFAYRSLTRSEGRRAEGDRGAEDSSAWGLPVVVAGLLIVILDSAIHTRYLSAIGFVICIPGLSLLFLGARRTRKLAFPLTLCLFLLPIPFSFSEQVFLRNATAVGVEPVLRLIGYPVTRELTVLMLPGFTIDVSAACSGFSALYASAFLAVVLAVHAENKWRGALLLLSVWPIAVGANILRAAVLVKLMDDFGRGILDTPVHGGSGAATFVLALGALYLLAGRETIRRVTS